MPGEPSLLWQPVLFQELTFCHECGGQSTFGITGLGTSGTSFRPKTPLCHSVCGNQASSTPPRCRGCSGQEWLVFAAGLHFGLVATSAFGLSNAHDPPPGAGFVALGPAENRYICTLGPKVKGLRARPRAQPRSYKVQGVQGLKHTRFPQHATVIRRIRDLVCRKDRNTH